MGLKSLPFTKMHGTGNDFVVVTADAIPDGKDPGSIAIVTSHRRFGVGSDGLLIIGPGRGDADLEMIFYNPDGTLAEMCGNGLRCVAKYAYDHHLVHGLQFNVRTGSGIKPVEVTVGAEGKVYAVECDMGVPEFRAAQVPVDWPAEEVIDQPVIFHHGDHAHDYRITCVSMGNPHVVILVDDVERLKLSHLGPMIETHPMFPAKTNAEFVQIVARGHVKIRIWERGAGETWSCGTGICAVFAALHRQGLCDDPLVVEVKGGEVVTRFDSERHILKKGPAVEIYHGEMLV
ncbi:MAG: diaminopimelate epimerase [bacterium]